MSRVLFCFVNCVETLVVEYRQRSASMDEADFWKVYRELDFSSLKMSRSLRKLSEQILSEASGSLQTSWQRSVFLRYNSDRTFQILCWTHKNKAFHTLALYLWNCSGNFLNSNFNLRIVYHYTHYQIWSCIALSQNLWQNAQMKLHNTYSNLWRKEQVYW